MLKRLRSLQEQCKSKTLPERPFCNIGQMSHMPQTPVANGSVGFQLNSINIAACASTPKGNSSLLPPNCVSEDSEEDLPSVTEKSAKRSCSEVDNSGTVPAADHVMSPTSMSPPRKRCRQDTVESFGFENGETAAVDAAGMPSNAALDSEKSSAVVKSPAEKSVDSINVELSSSALCDTFTASGDSVRRSGSYSQLTSFSRPASVVRSANSSPRTWPSRRDLGQFLLPVIVWSLVS